MTYYDFQDINKKPLTRPVLSPEAIYINGIPIEDQIDGFYTLNVSGRELVPHTISTQEVASSDGSMFLNARYANRSIKVNYRLLAKNDTDYREKFELLNYLLSPKRFDFKFYDDPFYFWTGTVTSVEEPAAGQNFAKGSFTIECTSPFKRRIEPVTYDNSEDGVIRISEPAYFETLPDEIKLVIGSKTSSISIRNDTRVIKLVGSFNAGDTLRIVFSDIPEKDSAIYLNNNLKLDLLDLTSDFENFVVKYQDVISVDNANARLYLKLRSKHL
ncbi:distal tail protein Dit [Lactobacillus mulieris]|uniref:distal tail protein Dit n=1 Tax=Lactobacillus mulieris TaxID=2508708 RepID=UPI00084E8BE7|nr:distal tail protein Dit [Lactobacillus mulieris]OEH66127.1 hypothetical protein BFX48_02040 [Lactobacillus jensenii]